MKKAVCLLFFVSTLLGWTPAQDKKLTATEAKNHVGEKATVCGTVASARYADRTNGQPTFLNLDEPYPKNVFTILIWGSNRGKFGEPETKYVNAKLCVTGTIASYRGAPEIVASDPDQISVQH